MAIPGQKRIRQLIEEKRGRITDRQLFTSRRFAAHLRNIVAAQSRRYNYARRVDIRMIWEAKNPMTAQTDNSVITINAASELVLRHKERPKRYSIILGLLSHETGHVLYTDFLGMQVYRNKMAAGAWHPKQPTPRMPAHAANCAEMKAFLAIDQYHAMAFLHEAHLLGNILEDGYVNMMMINRYPGSLGICLEDLYVSIAEIQPTVPECIEREEDDNGHIWNTVAQLMIAYVACGVIKYDGVPRSDPRIRAVFDVMDELDRGVENIPTEERWDIVNTIMMVHWPMLRGYLEKLAERMEHEAENAVTAVHIGTSGSGSGTTVSVEAPGGASGGKGSAAHGKAAIRAGLADEDTKEEHGAGGPEDTEADEDKDQEEQGKAPDMNSATGGPREVSPEEQGRLPRAQTAKIESGASGVGGMDRDDDYAGGGYVGAASDIERILDDYAEEKVFGELEKQRSTELNDLARSISYGNAHEGVSVTVHRMTEVPLELAEAYEHVAGSLLHISKLLRRQVEKQVMERRRGAKQTGLLMGCRLNGSALYRNDGRIFYKNSLPNENPELAVGLLLDESGSMAGRDRATYARAAAIILYDFCRALGIPITVYGHSTGRGVDLYSYVEFDAIDRNDPYRMMDISARGGNRDGAALRYVMEQVSKRPEEAKIVMLVSDGQPADTGYSGDAAAEDLRGIVQEYRRKGVRMIAAAVGDDREAIEMIYGDAYLNIGDLNNLPVALAAKIRLYLRAA